MEFNLFHLIKDPFFSLNYEKVKALRLQRKYICEATTHTLSYCSL